MRKKLKVNMGYDDDDDDDRQEVTKKKMLNTRMCTNNYDATYI